ncbi:hypothetical protein BDP81DRAFT_15854 [Colletotrichum phormii]|uniref:Uncharacterized protein n=1 Tax=Colletotrichum phormii TaxID=359342 RepID=A0AAJ0EK80_9PEZI|nr:uncharacterized protein BDP81DRAFT_15854 [Colletotrichum phormii]KAK1656130.1 hypothetical protein BDP81DRAFT_15854 [Colletotrichum phormii]
MATAVGGETGPERSCYWTWTENGEPTMPSFKFSTRPLPLKASPNGSETRVANCQAVPNSFVETRRLSCNGSRFAQSEQLFFSTAHLSGSRVTACWSSLRPCGPLRVLALPHSHPPRRICFCPRSWVSAHDSRPEVLFSPVTKAPGSPRVPFFCRNLE